MHVRQDEFSFSFFSFFFAAKLQRPSGASLFPEGNNGGGGQKRSLLEAVICVERPLAPAGGGVDVQPVGREHHEDEVGVQLLLLLFPGLIVVVWLHTCGSDSVSLEEGEDTEREKKRRRRTLLRVVKTPVSSADCSGTAASL